MALKICQLNVNGMSDMTVMALENYIKDQEIDIMCLSETKAKRAVHEERRLVYVTQSRKAENITISREN